MLKTKFGIYPYIDKKYILNNVSQEAIIQNYTNIPINNNTLEVCSFKSPFRVDNNPSCNYFYSDSGKLRIKDWSLNEYYDCFDVVGQYHHLNSSNKDNFKKILHIIAKDFKLNIYENEEYSKEFEDNFKKYIRSKPIKKRRKKVIFKVVLRNFNYDDERYFKQAQLLYNDLKGVYFIDKVYISINYQPYIEMYQYHYTDPCYGYYGNKDKLTDIDLWKFYFPFRQKGNKDRPKFRTNGVFMQGIQYMKPARFCVITKSYKDALVFKKLGIESCALSAEGIIPNKNEIWYFKTNYDYVFTCFDFDYVGIKSSNKLKNKHNFEPILFTNGAFNTKNYEAKDAFEFVSKNGLKKLNDIILNHYNKRIDYALEFEKEIYNKLKFIK